MGTNTTHYSLYKPTAGEDGWSASVDSNFDTIDTEIYKRTVTARSLWIPAEVLHVDGGPTYPNNIGGVGVYIPTANFTATGTSGLYGGSTLVPGDALAAQPLKAAVYYVAGSTESGTSIRWSYYAKAISSGSSATTASTQTTYTGTTAAKSGDFLYVETSTQILASVSAFDIIDWEVYRLGDDGADNYSGIAYVWGVRLDYTAVF